MIEITTGLLMILSTFSAIPAEGVLADKQATTTVNESIEDNTKKDIQESIDNNRPLTIQETEEYLRNYFEETPVMVEIARCESSFRHHDKNGNVLRGVVNDDDIGVMQINRYYHEQDALKLGFDIYTMQGNLEFAKVLYGKYGAKPWVHSSKCWGQGAYGHELAKR